MPDHYDTVYHSGLAEVKKRMNIAAIAIIRNRDMNKNKYTVYARMKTTEITQLFSTNLQIHIKCC